MADDPRDPVRTDPPGLVRRLITPVALLVIGLVLFFGGRSIYGLGQWTAAKLSGLDLTASETPAPTLPPTETSTATSVPAPTIVFFPPTATATKIPWTSCPGIVIRVTDTADGDILHVLRCADGLEYDIGPLTKGVYAVSPDDRYLVYCSLDGALYAARIGSPTLTVIRKVERDFFTFGRDMDPIFELTFNGGSPYVLEVYEKRYAQNLPIQMPRWLVGY